MPDQTQITVEEGNRLIAEFGGMKLEKTHYHGKYEYEWVPAFEHSNWCFETPPPFHKRWDWLKPVIDKIFTYAIAFPDQVEPVRSMKIVVDIQPAWERVVTFIQWYNSHKSKQ